MQAAGAGLSGKTIVLTGATSGIGRAIAERLAGGGASLAMVGRQAELLERSAAELGAVALVGDVTDTSFVSGLRERTLHMWGDAPDVLINNAGAFELAPIGETSAEAFERLIAVNLKAPFNLARLWLPDMLGRGWGHLINIGSIAGRRAFPGNSAYSASKYGLRGLHEVLVEELRGTGVRVSWIEPSAVDTPLWDRFDPDSRSDLPSRAEMLRPEDVADSVHFVVAQPTAVNVEEIVIRANPTGQV
jgi:NADP-dependent 3-hydroxy acid dehydrogenase YdfG